MLDDADKFLKIAVGLGVLAAGAGLGYHYGVYLPEIEREKMAALEKERAATATANAARKQKYNACLVDAWEIYSSNWDENCKSLGRKKDCKLPTSASNRWDEEKDQYEKRCLDEFKSGI
jgi:hypothetical protein